MRFIFASTLTLAAAAAALPTENSLGKKHDLVKLQQKCGDLTISCCSQVVIQGNGGTNGLGLEDVLGSVTGTLTGTSTASNSVCGQPGLSITTMIGNLIGASRMFHSPSSVSPIPVFAHCGLEINIRAD
jgi:hypothetical protein